MSPANAQDQTRFAYTGSQRKKRRFTNAEIDKALKDAYNSLNLKGPMSREAYQRYYEMHQGSVPHSFTIIRRFEKWNDALKHAKLPTTNRQPYKATITKGDCIRALLACRDDMGHLPSTGQYADWWFAAGHRQEKHPSVSTIRVKFKKWSTASEAALKFIDKEDEAEEL
jgi:hypothetical protein